jgi:hypothetical protein
MFYFSLLSLCLMGCRELARTEISPSFFSFQDDPVTTARFSFIPFLSFDVVNDSIRNGRIASVYQTQDSWERNMYVINGVR